MYEYKLMCGIVGAVAQRNITEILIKGLQALEYRGYDSAGLAVVDSEGKMTCLRRTGKVQSLADAAKTQPLLGNTGIAHTRWATHGKPSELNAHPHLSTHIAVVHNGIIENYESLRNLLIHRGYNFTSETDTEVIAHLIDWQQRQQGGSLLEVMQPVVAQLSGTYGVVVMDSRDPARLVAARSGSPLVIGCGEGENFIASDELALLKVARRFIYLAEGDLVEMTHSSLSIFDGQGNAVQRAETAPQAQYHAGDKGLYRHYMQKEIHEQPLALQQTLTDRINNGKIDFSELGSDIADRLTNVQHIQIVACGTSYHAGLVARYWFESLAGIPCDVEISSEFRYRQPVVRANSLLITLSQSGETADTLAALRLSKTLGYLASLAICNVAGSSLVRESDMALMTKAGIEIGVASTKAFTTQLAVLLMLVAFMGKKKGRPEAVEHKIVHALQTLPVKITEILTWDNSIANLANNFYDKKHALFIGRGELYPIAMEGALKLKEISYIHAEAYAAGELKHGPLALIDENMPVIVIAPKNSLLEKLKSNIEEIRARGGELSIFTDKAAAFNESKGIKTIQLPQVDDIIAPIFYTVALQLLSYHVALIKKTDVDQPRNLAKSVTVE
ncbi:D-fructose-6-phosphate amidotransferase [Candidatus Regiella insecticola LSR1]|uniref:Glutamine--fructose-6-phosphate aminotransferase [isomerizing] n=2 Tax=Candidatus Regiella insecticola TaxID=138073 RepID=E0WT03_9ENTR|nr:D-fructose-6-phosphate amidotransferase [Candidatus Regiella insecticola LSR1]